MPRKKNIYLGIYACVPTKLLSTSKGIKLEGINCSKSKRAAGRGRKRDRIYTRVAYICPRATLS